MTEPEPSEGMALRNALIRLRTIATRLGTHAVLCGRIKSPSAIARKMIRLHRERRPILDVLGVRIITASTRDCYVLADQIRIEFDTLEEEFDDYVTEPKLNGYQSIHATIIQDGFPVEVQIRTRVMHSISERGSAKREPQRGR